MNCENSSSLLIKGATVLLPGGPEETDVACRDGRIVAIGEPFQADTIFEARGLHLLPCLLYTSPSPRDS